MQAARRLHTFRCMSPTQRSFYMYGLLTVMDGGQHTRSRRLTGRERTNQKTDYCFDFTPPISRELFLDLWGIKRAYLLRLRREFLDLSTLAGGREDGDAAAAAAEAADADDDIDDAPGRRRPWRRPVGAFGPRMAMPSRAAGAVDNDDDGGAGMDDLEEEDDDDGHDHDRSRRHHDLPHDGHQHHSGAASWA